MKSGLLKLMELKTSSRTSLIESKIIVHAGFLGSRVCEGKVSASTEQEARDGITASYLVGQQIQGRIQNIRGFGEEKLPDRFWADGVPGAITGQQPYELLCFQRWQLHGGNKGLVREERMPLGFYKDSCSGVSPRHKQTLQQSSHKNLCSSGYCGGAAARLYCWSSKTMLIVTTQ